MDDTNPLISKINSPKDLKALPEKSLPDLAEEIRSLIIEVVSRNGGHLASNLGVVELTIALHRVFNSPVDKIVWDVGHQCYTHKILTGRRESFASLRTLGGISGFPKATESPHDIVEAGHASTSISAALGILTGQRLRGETEGKVIAVIGDGALTGGQALEGLNQAGELARGLIIVLNDNNMSIAKNVGAISSYLSRLTTTTLYQNLKRRVDETVKRIPLLGEDLNIIIHQLEKGAKALIFPDTLFTDFGFHYVGPFDGHNIPLLTHVFRNVRRFEGPIVVHVKTQKGRGYQPAERNPDIYHGVSTFSIVDGKLERKKSVTYSEAFSETILNEAEGDDRIVAVTAAMTAGTGLVPFQKRYPDRFFDVGITEPHAVTFAAGLARSGLRPVLAVYSTFIQRAVDQVIHDVALPGLPVVLALDRAGLVGQDGETHQGIFDISLFRSVPGVTILAPASAGEMGLLFRYALEKQAPVILRYPKAVCSPEWEGLLDPVEPGRGVFIHKNGGEVLFLSLGGILPEVREAANLLSRRGIACDILNLRFVKPLDTEYLAEIVSGYRRVYVVEEGAVAGGLGESISHSLRERKIPVDCVLSGIPDRFISHGTREELIRLCGLDPASLASAVERSLAARHRTPLKIFKTLP